MNARPYFLALTLALAPTGHAQFSATLPQSAAPQTGPAPVLVEEGLSPYFLAVASKLELGGTSFVYAEQQDTFNLVADLLDGLIKTAPKSEGFQLPEDFSVRTFLHSLGLDGVKATGLSSRQLSVGRYHSRSFAYMPDGRKGLAGLSGGPAEPFLLHGIAPSGSDLALEFPLRTKGVVAELLAAFLPLLPQKEREALEAQLDAKQPPIGMSLREMLSLLDARAALLVRINPEQSFPAGQPAPIPLPGVDAALILERLEWLLEPLKQQFLPLLADPKSPVERTEKDGILTLKFRSPVGPAPMDFQPTLQYEASKGRLIVSTRASFLQSVLSPADKLTTQPAFQKAWQGMPSEGNGSLYVSERFLATSLDLLKESLQQPGVDAALREMAGPLAELLAGKLTQPQAFCYANQPDGTLGVANSLLPLKGNTSALSGLTSVGMFAAMALPNLTQAKAQAEHVKSMNDGRNIGMALKAYANDHNGRYPQKLEELTGNGGLPDELPLQVLNPLTQQPETWLYDATLTETSPTAAILLASPGPVMKGGKASRIVIRFGGNAEVVAEELFELQKGPGLK
jgi:type II secretory pathway pseudopilin PulG